MGFGRSWATIIGGDQPKKLNAKNFEQNSKEIFNNNKGTPHPIQPSMTDWSDGRGGAVWWIMMGLTPLLSSKVRCPLKPKTKATL